MMSMICKDDQRRTVVRAPREMNGLDYVEVLDDGRTLLVYFIGKLPHALREDRPVLNKLLRIEGGQRVHNLRILDVDPHLEEDPELDDYLIVNLDQTGDFSTYTLRLVGLEGIDPRYDHVDFSFKVDCPRDLDCATPDVCPPPKLEEPDINYLAKDYASFHQLILDRLALTMPDWQERHVPDLGIALVELLAYTGDQLSYYQDAVSTEAYLETARQRISVRRHARLVDYFLHEGCNARAWLCLSIFGGNLELDLSKVYFATLPNLLQSRNGGVLTEDEIRQSSTVAYEVFEPILRSKKMLLEAHNEVHFHTWGQLKCCLPRGATSATLRDEWVYVANNSDKDVNDNNKHHDEHQDEDREIEQTAKHKPPKPSFDRSKYRRALDLHKEDELIFEEVIGPKTGNPADADPARRCAVRLTSVTLREDLVVPTKVKVNGQSIDAPTPVVDIEWGIEDALPFALCISAIGPAPECRYMESVSVARGNIILVDHGRTIRTPESLGTVPLKSSNAKCECAGKPGDVIYWAGEFHPRLERTGLTYLEPILLNNTNNHEWVPASKLVKQDPHAALPQIRLSEVPALPDEKGDLVPLFEMQDLTDPTNLIRQMRDPKNNSGGQLRRKLSRTINKELKKMGSDESPSSALIEDVRKELQSLMRFWEPRFDLLGSGPDDLHFVLEIDNDGRAHIRFGNGELGEKPPAGSAFYADYRVGSGIRGNLGAEAISYIVLIGTSLSGVDLRVRNPLPSMGGTDPEPMAEAKLNAPFAFRKQLERAIIASDYAKIAKREFESRLQGANAQLAWTGSWYEAEVALDPYKSEPFPDQLVASVSPRLERYRRMGHDLRVEAARNVPLDIELFVCVKPDYLQGHVKAALLDVFSNRVLPGGRFGFFHPDRLTFGEDIYLSQLVAAAMEVEGVESASVSKLQRLYEPANQEIENGVLPLGPFEIAQVDNDPNFPEHGQFIVKMDGGR